jgi:aerobic carbon-monoxide dehydrogenase small subunit
MKLTINNKKYEVDADPMRRLLDVLREDLKLVGTKEGCGEGECGACSVILNGRLINACLVAVGQLEKGDEILTIEGLQEMKEGKILQDAFIEGGAVQCGFCTPGLLMASYSLLKANHSPNTGEIKEGIAGNLCRCTGYSKIVSSIETAVRRLGEVK